MSPFDEGYQAYWNGEGPEANAYEDGENRFFWNTGWVWAEYDDASRTNEPARKLLSGEAVEINTVGGLRGAIAALPDVLDVRACSDQGFHFITLMVDGNTLLMEAE